MQKIQIINTILNTKNKSERFIWIMKKANSTFVSRLSLS